MLMAQSSDTDNLKKCIEGYNKNINAVILARHMSALKSCVERMAKELIFYPLNDDDLVVEDAISVIIGVNTSCNKNIYVTVMPSVKALYILCDSYNIDRLILFAPHTVDLVCVPIIYSLVPVAFRYVTPGMLIVPNNTSVCKKRMEKNGWCHYYSDNNKDSPHRLKFLDFTESCTDVQPGLDFYFNENNSSART